MKNIMLLTLFLLSFNAFSKEENVVVKEACVSIDKGGTAVLQCSDGTVTIINMDKTTVCVKNNGLVNCHTVNK